MKFNRVIILLAFLCLCYSARGTDITTGYSFSSGEPNVTHTKLNNQVNLAVINPGFYTDKPAVTAASPNDLALIYSSALTGYRKITLNNLFFSNPFIITNLTADATPASDDYLLTYDVSVAAMRKVTLRNLVFENADLIANRTNWPTPLVTSTFLLAYDSSTGEYSKLTRSNLFYQFGNFATFTNLASATPLAADKFLMWDHANATNRAVTFGGLSDAVSNNVYSSANFASNAVANMTQFLSISNKSLIQVTANIPYDDTVPQSSEGTNLLTLTITPRNTSNWLEITASVTGDPDNDETAILALFQDIGGANAIAAEAYVDADSASNSGNQPMILRHVMRVNTNNATVFTLRGGVTGNNFWINGKDGGRKLGGAQGMWLTIRETP